jgi:hypothetical protein
LRLLAQEILLCRLGLGGVAFFGLQCAGKPALRSYLLFSGARKTELVRQKAQSAEKITHGVLWLGDATASLNGQMADIKGTFPSAHGSQDARLKHLRSSRYDELIQLKAQNAFGSCPPTGENMENTQRRAIGLLMVFATVLTLIAAWNLPEPASTERAVSE